MSEPEVYGTVTVPEYFSPSKLHGATQCRLRAVQEASYVRDRLPAGPAAEFGTVLHEVFELAVGGAFVGADDVSTEIRRKFDELLSEREAKLLESQSRRHFVPLKAAFPPGEWRDKVGSVIQSALWATEAASRKGGAGSSGEPGSKPTFDKLPDGEWSEISITSSLRIRGKMDLVTLAGNEVAVKDLKTGRTHDASGEIVDHIAAQLRFYGLAVKERRPNAVVRLAVIKGREFEVPFSTADEREARGLLDELLKALPADAGLDAEELASPGAVCQWCSVRHRCPAYRAWAPSQWTTDDVQLPSDTWGEVIEVHGSEVLVRDAAGRHVAVHRVDTRHGQFEPGMKAWFFGLARARPKWGSLARHPVAFWELPAHRKQPRAWALQVFMEE